MNLFRKLFKITLFKILPRGIYHIYFNYCYCTNPKNYRVVGKNVHLIPPLFLYPDRIELESYTRLQTGVHIIASEKQKVVIKKYTVISAETLIIPGTHTPTVGIPQYLSYSRINDVNGTLVIPEDVWVGARCIILHKAKIGRGCVVGAGSVVTKTYPPYSVIAGSPAKIIAVRFSLEQIIKHEESLYSIEERLDKSYLQSLFDNEYKNLRVIGTDNISKEDFTFLNSIKEYLSL